MSKETFAKVPFQIKEENGQIIIFNEEYNLSAYGATEEKALEMLQFVVDDALKFSSPKLPVSPTLTDEMIDEHLWPIFKAGMKNQELHPDDDSYDEITATTAFAKFTKWFRSHSLSSERQMAIEFHFWVFKYYRQRLKNEFVSFDPKEQEKYFTLDQLYDKFLQQLTEKK